MGKPRPERAEQAAAPGAALASEGISALSSTMAKTPAQSHLRPPQGALGRDGAGVSRWSSQEQRWE